MTDLELVAAELAVAKEKHPHFVDQFTSHPEGVANFFLRLSRRRLSSDIAAERCEFESVLECELREAIAAYADGDLEHARQELAQCAAVCIRGMELMSDKIAKRQDAVKLMHEWDRNRKGELAQ